VATRFEEQHPAVSPDGRWLAFTSDQSGRNEVYVRPLHGEGEQVQDSVDGWHRNRLVAGVTRAVLPCGLCDG